MAGLPHAATKAELLSVRRGVSAPRSTGNFSNTARQAADTAAVGWGGGVMTTDGNGPLALVVEELAVNKNARTTVTGIAKPVAIRAARRLPAMACVSAVRCSIPLPFLIACLPGRPALPGAAAVTPRRHR
jgi:hypothetical protein